MSENLKAVPTRFRAYQLGQAGSSFSYFADNHFTLIEGRITEVSHDSLREELKICGKKTIDLLHITSWDQDHCDEGELSWILCELQPRKIEYPGYEPHTKNGEACLVLIKKYVSAQQRQKSAVVAQKIDPPYINSLSRTEGIGYRDIFYHPRQLYPSSNNNSSVKLLRKGMFNVASLGDIEHANIGAMLRRCNTFKSEVDVLILAHHGSDNAVNTKNFLQTVKPAVAICTSNYDNQYDHPHQPVKDALHQLGIKVFTTKTGDVLIESVQNHRKEFKVTNLITNSTVVSSEYKFVSKKFILLSMNADTLRNRQRPGFKGLKWI